MSFYCIGIMESVEKVDRLESAASYLKFTVKVFEKIAICSQRSDATVHVMKELAQTLAEFTEWEIDDMTSMTTAPEPVGMVTRSRAKLNQVCSVWCVVRCK
jgi:predicted kinase